ncbi:arsenate reductase family protein [Alkalicoccus urumqiensis]|uniref:ArsC family transcriptional regulator n=1 Tax=Alkalicoccus urumqiensis TaxID=1548213 RepID=A0A2P6MGZ4_ALKUR|nr:arsenate reductase family protein [Alkalicoccus urumqiensis]PRO65551.1 ArsC family transcriptional regulator [Alkalicoccus urumqiensis]
MIVYEYPKCSTCRKALQWLDENDVSYEKRHIVEETPDAAEIRRIHEKSGLPLKKLFNTSGKAYREQGLKDKVDTMDPEEAYELLSTNGMLMKRPLAVGEKDVTAGFREAEYESVWKNESK